MAEQATAGIVEGPGGTAAQPAVAAHHGDHFNGRGISWVGTGIVCAGFIVGGFSFAGHVHWWLFWVGTAIAVVGCLILAFAKTMSEDWY